MSKRPMIVPLCRGLSMLLACLVSTAVSAETAPDPWLIVAPGETGSITVKTTREDLVRTFAAANVVDQDVDIGEGQTEPGTVVFPKDAKRSIEILWKNAAAKREPKSITIHGDASSWKTAHDISLGTSLKDLERLNGKPFHLAGFSWDYSGTVTSWDGGSLEKDLAGKGRVILRLDSDKHPGTTDQEMTQVVGEGDHSSHHPVMQKLNPRIYEIIWIFP